MRGAVVSFHPRATLAGTHAFANLPDGSPHVTLALRLLVAFGFVAIFATCAVGLSMRDASRRVMEAEFVTRISAAEKGTRIALQQEVAGIRGLLGPMCEHDTIVDRTLLELEK